MRSHGGQREMGSEAANCGWNVGPGRGEDGEAAGSAATGKRRKAGDYFLAGRRRRTSPMISSSSPSVAATAPATFFTGEACTDGAR